MLSRQSHCPTCDHEHLWLDCDWCDCNKHLRNGIYDE